MGTLISVIMSTYNESEDYIRSSVSSILRQTLHDLELIIVIDNPENEAAVTVVNAFASEDSRVKILRNERNLGLVRSLNKAISAAHGEILARMDADDISMPQRLEKQMAFMEHEQFDIVGAVTQYIDENGMPVAGGHTYKTEKQLKRILQFEGYRLGIIDEVLLYYRYNLNGISQSREFRQFLAFSYLSAHRDSPSAVSEEEINIGISMQKGNSGLQKAINSVLATLTPEDFKDWMNQAIAVQPMND